MTGQFGLFSEGRVSVEAVHRKFDAKVVEVEPTPGTDHGFSLLEAATDGHSLDSFKPALEHTYAIKVTPNAGEPQYSSNVACCIA